jgi:amphi-Trp domain-containing protein
VVDVRAADTSGGDGGRHTDEGADVAGAPRDVERIYSTAEVVAKLRRLADALESGSSFRIQIAGERFRVPAGARFSVEHERGDGEEEVEFQLKWKLDGATESDATEGSAGDVLV